MWYSALCLELLRFIKNYKNQHRPYRLYMVVGKRRYTVQNNSSHVKLLHLCYRFWRSAKILDSTLLDQENQSRQGDGTGRGVQGQPQPCLEHLLGGRLTVSHVVRNDFMSEGLALHIKGRT